MTERGFDYPAAAPAASGSANLQALEDQAVGITSLADAQTYGYGQPKGQPPRGVFFVGPGAAFNISVELRHHQAAWLSALLGIGIRARAGARPRLGCLRQVASAVYGLSGNAIVGGDPVLGLAFQALQWSMSDPRVRAVNRLWSQCMARRGFSFASPAAAAGHRWPKAPNPVEISTAEADLSCKAQTNLENTSLAVEAAYQRALIGQNLAVLSQLQARSRALLQRADALLRGTG